MKVRRIMFPAAAGALLVGAAPAGQNGAADGLRLLGGIERGEWQFVDSDGDRPRRLCVTDPMRLFQIEHGKEQCTRMVLEKSDTSVTVHYTCPGHGHGRTVLSVETPRLINIDTQGVADGSPFALTYEGRRVGDCANAGVRH